jgi:hypothetical protein
LNIIYNKDPQIQKDTDEFVGYKMGYFADRLRVLKSNRVSTYTDHGGIDNISNESEIVRRALVKPPEVVIKSQIGPSGKVTSFLDNIISTKDNESVRMFTKTCFDNMFIKKAQSSKVALVSKKSILLSNRFKYNIGESTSNLPKIVNNNTSLSNLSEESVTVGRSRKASHRKKYSIDRYESHKSPSRNESFRRSTGCGTPAIHYVDCLAMDNKMRLMRRNICSSLDQNEIFKNMNRIEKIIDPDNENLDRLYRQSVVKEIKGARRNANNNFIRKAMMSERVMKRQKRKINKVN